MLGISDASSQSARKDACIYCSPEDKEYLQDLKKYFKYYRREYNLDVWDDTRVLPGSMWQHEMMQALESAKVAVLLISVDFFASDLIVEQILPQLLTAAKQENITIINVILRHCDFETTELAQFQPVNPPSRPLVTMEQSEQEEIWTKVAKLVRKIVTEQTEATFERLFDQTETLKTAAHYFFQCRYMKDKRSREQVLRRLSEKTVREIDAFPITDRDDHNVDFAEVLNIVRICSSDQDGLGKLAYALYQSEHASLPWQDLDKYLRKSGEKLVTYTRLQELYEILRPAKWLDHLLRIAYSDSVPENWDMLHDYHVPDKLLLILEDLVKIPRQNNDTFPILEFVQRLAYIALERQDTSLHDALRKWIQERSSDLSLTESQQATLREKAKKRRQPTAFYLLLLLDAVSDGVFCVQTWLLDDENCIIQNAGIEMSDEPHSLEDMPSLLEDLLEKCENCLLEEMENLIIEFFLPLELLSYPVDQYLVGSFKKLQSIGLCHQVVVRSLERTQTTRGRSIWKNKWKLLSDSFRETQTMIGNKRTTMVYHEEHYKGQEDLSATLRGSSVACLALTFVPLNISSQTNDVLSEVLAAGVPVAIWPREGTDHPKALHELLSELVLQHPLSQLPALVKQQRYEAITSGNKQQHQGYHLTLLWDDPNRLPPSTMTPKQLVVPPVRRGA